MGRSIKNIKAFCENNTGFVKVWVQCTEGLAKPIIAIKLMDKNIQPTGEFSATLWIEELLFTNTQRPFLKIILKSYITKD